MVTKAMKWVSISLLLGAVLWRSTTGYDLLLHFVVSGSAIIVMLQAGFADKYFLATLFVVIAVLFNPVVPLALSHKNWPLNLACLAMFAISLALKTRSKPMPSMPSITDRTPGSESL